MIKRLFLAIALFTSLCYISTASAQTAKEIATYSDWTVHVYSDPSKKICFVSSQPTDKLPKNVKRGVVVFYISHWPKQKVKNEISVDVGYPLKKESQPVAVIGSESFKFIVKSDKAFVETPEMEKKMFAAMKVGSTMVLTGVSRRGTQTTDSYSLSGLSAALKKLETECK